MLMLLKYSEITMKSPRRSLPPIYVMQSGSELIARPFRGSRPGYESSVRSTLQLGRLSGYLQCAKKGGLAPLELHLPDSFIFKICFHFFF
jgi:hypothetical protein